MLPLVGSAYNVGGGRIISANDSSAGLSITQNGSGSLLEVSGSAGLVFKLYKTEIDFHNNVFLMHSPDATANYGLLSVGPGPWDGTSAGHYLGSISGGGFVANFAGGYTGDHIRTQVQGVDYFRFDGAGQLWIGNPANAVSAPASGALRVSVPAGKVAAIFGTTNAAWALALGSEAIPNLYIGSTAGPPAYFWRGNWSTASVAANTFQSAAQDATQVVAATIGQASQTGDLFQTRDSAANPQFGIANAGSGAAPIWALRVRRTSAAESMAQAHTAGAATGKAIQVLDDTGATIGWLNLTA